MRMHLEAPPPPSPPATVTTEMADDDDETARIEDEIAVLEARLQTARQRLVVVGGARAATTGISSSAASTLSAAAGGARAGATATAISSSIRLPTHPKTSSLPAPPSPSLPPPPPADPDATAQQHFLLLLADSALPLGSFAFSSGLESYLAHARGRRHSPKTTPPPSFARDFLPLSLASHAAATLPFVLAAHGDPTTVAALDDALDAAVVCPVGRRASVAQGRALLGIWERSLKDCDVPGLEEGDPTVKKAAAMFGALLRLSSPSSSSSSDMDGETGTTASLPPPYAGHLAPLFGAVARLLGLPPRQTAHVYLLGHAKALVSAAVRAGVLGPYQAQRVLALPATRRQLAALVDRHADVPVERAGQAVPALDLWAGRHELLYSRIFNS